MNSGKSWWAKVTETVIRDKRLSALGCRVFCELALWAKRGNPNVSRGQRAIAKAVGIHQETALICLRELEALGHIEIYGEGRQRRTYKLLGSAYRPARAIKSVQRIDERVA